MQTLTALVVLTQFLPSNPEPLLTHGVYQEWKKGTSGPRKVIYLGDVPQDALEQLETETLNKISMLVGPNRLLQDGQYTLTSELSQKGCAVGVGGLYEQNTGVASAITGMNPIVSEAVLLTLNFCLGYATCAKTMTYAARNENRILTQELIQLAHQSGLILPWRKRSKAIT